MHVMESVAHPRLRPERHSFAKSGGESLQIALCNPLAVNPLVAVGFAHGDQQRGNRRNDSGRITVGLNDARVRIDGQQVAKIEDMARILQYPALTAKPVLQILQPHPVNLIADAQIGGGAYLVEGAHAPERGQGVHQRREFHQ